MCCMMNTVGAVDGINKALEDMRGGIGPGNLMATDSFAVESCRRE